MNKLIFIIGTMIFISSIAVALIGIEMKVVGETPCVDGRNRINLEGIMCEDKVETFFGQHPALILFMLIPVVIGLGMALKGTNDVKGRKHDG